MSDGLGTEGFFEFLRKWNKQDNQTFVYLFNYRATSSITDIYLKNSSNWGVSHGDDMMMIFPMTRTTTSCTLSDDDLEFAGDFVRLLTNFAQFG